MNWIPFGGFVKIRGENNEHEEDPRSFINRPFSGRLKVLVAGVAMNFILAWVLISIGFIFGIPAAVDSSSEISKYAKLKNPQIAIMEVVPDLPASKAGIQPGDIMLFVDNKNFSEIEQMRNYIKSNAGNVFDFKIKRADREMNIKVSSTANPPAGEGPTGIALANIGKLTVPWYIAPWEGAKATVSQIYSIVTGIYKLITAKLGWGSLGGPIKIAQLTGEVRHMGFDYLIQFTAFLSLNLAVLNILPFPALDGGRVLFLIIEKIRRKRNNQKVEQFVNTLGFVFLILLMILVTFKDVRGV
ncbi:MAG: RIP metalloprotease RseP [Candidatus Doudnabacteria bacterium]|nr:RIP metalloprotease RseP [Candidatus Doudnabacteria bacterium]